MKLLNIVAAVAISGLFCMAAHASLIGPGMGETICEVEYKACKKAGKPNCDAEKDKCSPPIFKV